MADLKAHPLLGELHDGIDASFQRAVAGIRAAPAAAPRKRGLLSRLRTPPVAAPPYPEGELAKLLKERSKPLTLLTLSGYLGEAKDKAWVRLYLDETLNSFYILRREDILNRERRKDDTAAKGEIDVVWLSRDAQIARGRRQPRPDPEEAKFIEGGFIAASDAAGSLLGDSRRGAAGDGWYVDTTTPQCCRKNTTTYPR